MYISWTDTDSEYASKNILTHRYYNKYIRRPISGTMVAYSALWTADFTYILSHNLTKRMSPSSKSVKVARVKEKNGSAVRAVSAYNQFRGPVCIFGKPVVKEILFSDHRGTYKKKIEKRQRRFLVKIPFINAFLEDGEAIMLVTSGYGPFTRLERFLLRYLTVFQRRALFVFTDRRALYIPTTFTYGFRHSVAEIRYASCKRIDVVGSSLVFTFHSGGLEKFPYIGRKERRKLRALSGSFALGGSRTGSQKLTYLCARCRAAVPKNSALCPKCRLRFRTAATAGKMALLIPGGGYFYMNNPLYGVADAIVELLLSVLLILSVMDVYRGLPGSVPAVILLSMVLGGVKAISFFHSQDLLQGCFPAMGQLSAAKSQHP